MGVNLESTGSTTAGFEIPEQTVDELAGGKHPKVVVTVNGFEFRTSIARMGGRYLLGVSAERRAQAGLAAGDEVEIELALDTAERTVEVPPDLAQALDADPDAGAFWDSLSYSNRSWHVLQITGAKKPATREARVARTMAALAARRPR